MAGDRLVDRPARVCLPQLPPGASSTRCPVRGHRCGSVRGPTAGWPGCAASAARAETGGAESTTRYRRERCPGARRLALGESAIPSVRNWPLLRVCGYEGQFDRRRIRRP